MINKLNFINTEVLLHSKYMKIYTKINMDSIFFYILAIFILALPYNIGAWQVGTPSILLFLITLANPSRRKTFSILNQEKSLKLLFIFILFTYISVLWSRSPILFNGDLHTNIDRFKYYFLIIPAIYLSNLSKKNINNIFFIVASAPLLSIIIYYTNHLGISHIFAAQNQNKNLILHHYLIQNFFILFSILFIYIYIFTLIEEKKYKNLLIYVPIFLFESVALVIDYRTNSRLMDLAFLLVFITVPYYYLSARKYISLIIIIIAVSSLVIAKNTDFRKGIYNFDQTIKSGVYNGSWGHRTGYLLAGIDIFIRNPIIGRGINDITRPINQIAKEKPQYFRGEHLRHFHNGHLNILVAVGIIGYSLLIYFLILLFRIKIKDKRIHIFKNTTILIMLFIMMGEHYLTFKTTTNFFAILIALFVTYKNIEDTNPN